MTRFVLVAFAVCACAAGQTLSFDVASVKPSDQSFLVLSQQPQIPEGAIRKKVTINLVAAKNKDGKRRYSVQGRKPHNAISKGSRRDIASAAFRLNQRRPDKLPQRHLCGSATVNVLANSLD